MVDKALVKKLQIKSGYRMVILNAPQEYQQLLGDLPAALRSRRP